MDYELSFQFKPYQNHFKQPLQTSHGVWRIREGIIISLTNSAGVTGRGEIAPLPWFGSETMAEAEKFCQQLGTTITRQEITTIDDRLPSCQFAFESAYLALNSSAIGDLSDKLDFCYLLPAGEEALSIWQDIFQNNIVTTFKWKIGVLPLAAEIKILQQLIADLPPEVNLRLDANGGLNIAQAKRLLSVTDSLKAIEFIEQPLAPDRLDNILQLSREYTTLLALDESVASFKQLQQVYRQGWQGVYVIKAAIMGYPSRMLEFCQNNQLDVVFSSVFETKVGRQTVLSMAQKINHPRALGFGVKHWFEG